MAPFSKKISHQYNLIEQYYSHSHDFLGVVLVHFRLHKCSALLYYISELVLNIMAQVAVRAIHASKTYCELYTKCSVLEARMIARGRALPFM